MPIPNINKEYTYQDYLTWPDDERWEIIEGVPYDMSPSPNTKHQTLVGNLFGFLHQALKGKECVPWIAPLDVVFSEKNVVQPDIIIVCDRSKETEKNIQGPPDVVFEVLSPYTSRKDRWNKKILYEKFGVKEYLVIEPEAQYVEHFRLISENCFDKGRYIEAQEELILKSIGELKVPLWEVFEIEPSRE